MTRETRKRIRDVGTNCLSTYIRPRHSFCLIASPPRHVVGQEQTLKILSLAVKLVRKYQLDFRLLFYSLVLSLHLVTFFNFYFLLIYRDSYDPLYLNGAMM
jgi:hypothetical protein